MLRRPLVRPQIPLGGDGRQKHGPLPQSVTQIGCAYHSLCFTGLAPFYSLHLLYSLVSPLGDYNAVPLQAVKLSGFFLAALAGLYWQVLVVVE